MKRLFAFLTLSLFVASAALAQYYYIPYLNTPGNPGGLNQDGEYPLGSGLPSGWTSIQGSSSTPVWSSTQSVPFSFSFNGSSVTQYKVSTSGVLTFSVSASSVPPVSNSTLPSSSIPDKSVCIWGLNGPGSNDNIVTKTFGSSPNRQHWILFSSFNHYNGSGSCWTYWSIVLEETTNNIYIVDQRTTSACSPALTLGVQVNSTTAVQVQGSPSVSNLAGTDPTDVDNVYYEFIQGSQPNYDIAGLTITTSEYLAIANAPFTIKGDIQNQGATTITSFGLSYSIDGGSPVTQTISGVNISSASTYSFTHPTGWTPQSTGTYTIKVWASNINGSNADQNNSNDTITKQVQVLDDFVQRIPLVEDFGSSTCPPCATLAATLDPMLNSNAANDSCGDVTAVKYEMNWPSPGDDPSYNQDGETRKNFYGVGGIPDPYIDGMSMPTRGQTDIDDRRAIPAFLDIIIKENISGNTVSPQVKVAALSDFNSSNMKLHIAVTEDFYSYTGGTTSQTEYHQVMRKMLPNGSGTSIGPLSEGDTATVNQTFTFTVGNVQQNNYNLWVGMSNVTIVAWVQDDATKEVHQSGVLHCPQVVTGITEEGERVHVDQALLEAYPNPAVAALNVKYYLGERQGVDIALVNVLSDKVYGQSLGTQSSGVHDLQLDVNELSAGMYLLVIEAGGEQMTRKVMIGR